MSALFKETRNKVMKGTFFLSISNALVRFISFFNIIAITWAVNVREYGLLTLIISIVGMITSFINMGTDELIVADISRSIGNKDLARAKTLLTQFFGLRFFLLVAIIFAAALSKNLLEARYGYEFINLFWLVVIFLLTQYTRNLSGVVLNIYEKFKLISAVNVLDVSLRLMLIIIFMVFWKINLATLIGIYIIGNISATILVIPDIVKLIKYFLNIPALKKNLIYETLKEHGKWQVATEIISGPVNVLRYWLIKIFISTEAIGIFALAQNLYSALASLIPLKSVLFPIIAKQAQDRNFLEKILEKGTKYSMFLHILIFIIAQIFAPTVVPLIFPKYALAIPLFRIFAIRLLMNPFSAIQSSVMFICRYQKIIFFCSIIPFLSAFTFLPIALLCWGIMGSVIESLITVSLIIIIREIYIYRKMDLRTFKLRSFFAFDEEDKLLLKEISTKFRNKVAYPKQYL